MFQEFDPRVNPYDLSFCPEKTHFRNDADFLHDLASAVVVYRVYSKPEDFEQIVHSSAEYMERVRELHTRHFNKVTESDKVAELYVSNLMRELPNFWAKLEPQTKTVIGAMIYIRMKREEFGSFGEEETREGLNKEGLDENLVFVYWQLFKLMTEYRLGYPGSINIDKIAARVGKTGEAAYLNRLSHPRNQEELIKRMAAVIKMDGMGYKRPLVSREGREITSTFGISKRQINKIVENDGRKPRPTLLEVIQQAEAAAGLTVPEFILGSLESTVNHMSTRIKKLDQKRPSPSLNNYYRFAEVFGFTPGMLKYTANSKGWELTAGQILHKALETAKGREIPSPNYYHECETQEDFIAVMKELILKYGKGYKTPSASSHKKDFRQVFGLTPQHLTNIVRAKGFTYTPAQLRNLAEKATGL